MNVDTINQIKAGAKNIVAVYYKGDMIWPKSHAYSLTGLQVKYSNNSNYISPSCVDYAYLQATLYDTYLGQTTTSTVTLTPVISSSNELYTFFGTNVLGNSSKKTTEYGQQSSSFTGYYTINDINYYPKSGSTIQYSTITLIANQMTKITTAYGSVSLSDERVAAIGRSEANPIVISGIRTYTKHYTSNIDIPDNTESVFPTSWTATGPTGLSTVTNHPEYIKVDANPSLTEKIWQIVACYRDTGLEQDFCGGSVALAQNMDSYTYGNVTNVSFIYTALGTDDNDTKYHIAAKGGDAIATGIHFTQNYFWASTGALAGTITETTSGISPVYAYTVSYPNREVLNTDGKVSTSSLEKERWDYAQQIASVKLVITLNDKQGEKTGVVVNQQYNKKENPVESNIRITSPTPLSDNYYYFSNNGGSVALTALSTYTYTWTSEESDIEDKNIVSTASISGTGLSLTNSWYIKSEVNTLENETTGYVTVHGLLNTDLVARLNIKRQAATYIFDLSHLSETSIIATTTRFSIYVVSEMNGSSLSMNESNCQIVSGDVAFESVSVYPADDTIFKYTFTCPVYTDAITDRVFNIKFTQPNSGKVLNCQVTQAHAIAANISTNTQILIIGTTSGRNTTFTLTSTKAWHIETRYATYNYINNSYGTNNSALSISESSGSSCVNKIIRVTRDAYDGDTIVDIKITSDSVTHHVIVLPTLSLNCLLPNNTWQPTAAGGQVTAISTNCPTVEWVSSASSWLTAGDDNYVQIKVTANTSGSVRDGNIRPTAKLTGTVWGVNYDESITLDSSIVVTQTAITAIRVVIDEREHNMAYLVNANTGDLVSVPSGNSIIISGIVITDEQGHQVYTASGVITAGNSQCELLWDPGYPDFEVYVASGGQGSARWSRTAPSNYLLNDTVNWLV